MKAYCNTWPGRRWVLLVAVATMGLLLSFRGASGQALSAPVSRDPSIVPVSYDVFLDMSPEETWHQIDELEYWAIPLAPPAHYYESVDASTATILRSSLHARIRNHRVFPYTHSSKPGESNHHVDTWDIIALADAHPEAPQSVLDIYMNATFARQLSGPPGGFKYDREHSWPKSLGFPTNATSNPAYSDCHHLFAAYSSYNGSRSNKPYGEESPAAEVRKPTVENLRRGGAHGAEEDTANYSFATIWQTWIGRRGDVARALMYLDVRYESSPDQRETEADLQLTDDPSQITTVDAASVGGSAFMGLKSVLLKWNDDDPVDDLERRRNSVVYLFQGNRNPFVDHPEWINVVYGIDSPAAVVSVEPWINELHYDNAGEDANEFVEIAGPAGLDLSGWQLIGYNGNGGKVYDAIALRGSIPDQEHGFGVLAFDFPRLQNGPADGLALIDPSHRLVELLSYEGRFTATDGLADGGESMDIEIEETAATPVGQALQRRGQGNHRGAFTWDGPSPASRGAPNAGQSFP